ncbi:MAG: ribonuclease E activity regulator RraA [Chromatocurvus sp.]
MSRPTTAVNTPDLSDAHPRARALELQWRSFGAVDAFSGPAVTIKCHEDNSLLKAAVSEAGEGRVLVVDGGGSLRRSLLGDMLAETAARNDWAGFVIAGAVRDVDALSKTAVGIKALGVCPIRTDKRGEGQRDVVVDLGGVSIAPGDFIYADNNGVLCSSVALS